LVKEDREGCSGLFQDSAQDNDEDEWFKMQVWLFQYLIRDFKESDSAIIDAHDPEVFKLRLVQNDGSDADAKHVRRLSANM
jgi:hypothetical protein